MQRSLERGQTLLIVVLIMVVSLTVGLAVASRSIVNLRTSTEEENSQRAFSAAEAGVEQLLKATAETDLAGDLENKANFTAQIADVDGTSFLVNSGNPIAKGDGVDIWLTSHNDDDSLDYSTRWAGNLTVYWGLSADTCSSAAIELILLSGQNSASAKTSRYAFDPCDTRRGQNHFQNTGSGAIMADKNFRYSATINGITDGIVVRLMPIYQSTSVGVLGSVALPSQGKIINSTGSAGTTSRKITYFQGYPELPSELFPHILFWPTQ